MLTNEPLKEPRPGNGAESLFKRQLRTWGRDVVRAILKGSVIGDGRRIAVTQIAGGGVGIKYMEDPPPEVSFWAYWNRGAPYGNSAAKLIVRAGNVHTPVGSYSIAEQSITPPASGDVYYWIQVAYNFGASTAAATWQSGASFPAFAVDTDADGNYDRINIPICWIDEISTGVWQIYQRQYGDAVIGIVGKNVSETLEQIDSRYSTVTGKFEKKMINVAYVRGVLVTRGTTTWSEVFQAADCTTTTT
jgi:hypothetical protein